MRVVVAGASGYVGKHVLMAAPAGAELFALARSRGDDDGGPVEWVDCDLSCGGSLEHFPETADVVIHLAQSPAPSDFSEAPATVDVNVGGTARLLDYARRAGVRRFVLASTATVYSPSTEPLHEGSAVGGSSLYAASKLAAETVARAYGELFGVTALRIFTVYGPRQTGRLIPLIVERVLSGKAVVLKGEDGLLLSPVHVHDVARAIWAAAADETKGYDVVNVGGPDALSLRQIARLVGELAGREPIFDQQPTDIAGGWLADSTRMRERLRLDPASFTRFEDGARELVAVDARVV